jgi:hypothetical protein
MVRLSSVVGESTPEKIDTITSQSAVILVESHCVGAIPCWMPWSESSWLGKRLVLAIARSGSFSETSQIAGVGMFPKFC